MVVLVLPSREYVVVEETTILMLEYQYFVVEETTIVEFLASSQQLTHPFSCSTRFGIVDIHF